VAAVSEPVARSDLHKLALRLKVVEMLKIHSLRRLMHRAPEFWRRLIGPN